jgi:ATP-dependent DNA helicase RecG
VSSDVTGQTLKQLPHQLIMTATPIPRTLAMSLYTNLDFSVIDELPIGRKRIETTVVDSSRRAEVIKRVAAACVSGRQAYWVCTLIEESESIAIQAAEVIANELKLLLPGLDIGLVHGRLKADEKINVMNNFRDKKINLLVATTVIEVGVDIPNASLIIVENSERLGLSQLHQLRGRVGRGADQSHCVLLYNAPLSHAGKERLRMMRNTNDGFKIAEKDLELRGPGEVLGVRQTGSMHFRIADLSRDAYLMSEIKVLADQLIDNNPELVEHLIERWIGKSQEYVQA